MSEEEQQEGMLPPLNVGQQLPLKEMKATERFSRPLPRYTEASLVKKLEELGIGRPSTYAPTISTIQKRGYVEKRDKEGVKRDFRILDAEEDKISKDNGTGKYRRRKIEIISYRSWTGGDRFPEAVFRRYHGLRFHGPIEEEFDEVASGKMKWNKMIDDFYIPFKKDVENTIENAERIKGERELGIDAATGKKVIARMGRYGPMVQIGDVSDEEKPRFAKLKNTQSIETISFDEAMELFKLPRNPGQFEDKDVTVNIGRFGPYIAHDRKFYSLGRNSIRIRFRWKKQRPSLLEKRKAKKNARSRFLKKKRFSYCADLMDRISNRDCATINYPRATGKGSRAHHGRSEKDDRRM